MDIQLNIPLNGLTAAGSEFSWKVTEEFFKSFDNTEVSDALLNVCAFVHKAGRDIFVNCDVEGSVTVPCDRCLEDLGMPIDVHFRFKVKFGNGEDTQEDGDEVLFKDGTETEMDLAQIVYDYVCLSLPIQRVHAPGECNPDTVKYMSEETPADSQENDKDNIFAMLKDLF